MIRNLLILLLIAGFFMACGTTNDEKYFNDGKKFLKEHNYEKALKEFEKIKKEYPNSKYSYRVLNEMGKIYQSLNIKDLAIMESYRNAVECYRSVYTSFPDSANTPGALFMMGFIQANHLRQLDSAKISYNLFLKKYPKHDLAPSAKMELDNLGLSPEEILKKSGQKL